MMDFSVKSKISDYIDQNRENIIDDLCELIRIPSYRADPVPGGPYGENCRRALDASLAMFEREGLQTRVSDDCKYGLSYLEGDGHTIGIFAHSDVVAPGKGWLLTEPFTPVMKDGVIVGRGAKDNKAGVIESLYAVKAIKELGIPFRSTIMTFVGCNEETGMEDIVAFRENEAMPDLSFVPDCRYPICIGERPGIYFSLETSERLEGIDRIESGEEYAHSIPAWSVAMLPFSEDNFQEILSVIGGDPDIEAHHNGNQIFVEAKGVSKHPGVPVGSKNASRVLCGVFAKCRFLPEKTRDIMKFCDDWMEDWLGERFGIASYDPHFGNLHLANVGFLWDGNRLTLDFACKHGTNISAEPVKKQLIQAMEGTPFTFVESKITRGFYAEPDNKSVKLILDAYNEATGVEGKVYVSAGHTYASELENAFATGVDMPYIQTDLGLPKGHGGLHESDEYLNIESFITAIKTMTMMLLAADESLTA